MYCLDCSRLFPEGEYPIDPFCNHNAIIPCETHIVSQSNDINAIEQIYLNPGLGDINWDISLIEDEEILEQESADERNPLIRLCIGAGIIVAAMIFFLFRQGG
jgi:imidazoleglycerol phosphate synthase glutamine amidotransferase subunit HisH